jgi:hypothetical protein
MRRTTGFILAGLLVSVLVAAGIAQFASDQPDGLEYVAEEQGFADTAEEHDLADAPLADYGEGLTGNDALDTALAGIAGVAVTFAIGYGVFRLARRTAARPTGGEHGGG